MRNIRRGREQRAGSWRIVCNMVEGADALLLPLGGCVHELTLFLFLCCTFADSSHRDPPEEKKPERKGNCVSNKTIRAPVYCCLFPKQVQSPNTDRKGKEARGEGGATGAAGQRGTGGGEIARGSDSSSSNSSSSSSTTRKGEDATGPSSTPSAQKAGLQPPPPPPMWP